MFCQLRNMVLRQVLPARNATTDTCKIVRLLVSALRQSNSHLPAPARQHT